MGSAHVDELPHSVSVLVGADHVAGASGVVLAAVHSALDLRIQVGLVTSFVRATRGSSEVLHSIARISMSIHTKSV